MAVASAVLSGTWVVSSTSGRHTQSFSALVSVSAYLAHEFVVPANVSDFVLSLAVFSNMNAVGIQANNQVRVNFGGVGNSSYVSNASAGFLMTQWDWITGGTSGPLSLHFSNSGTDSSTVRVFQGTS